MTSHSTTYLALALLLSGGCASGSNDQFGGFGPNLDGGSPTSGGDTAGDSTTAGGGDASGSGDADEADDDSDPDDDGPGATTSNASEDGGPDTGSDVCDPPCGPGDSCVAGVCFPTGGSTGSPECHDVDGEYAQCLGVGNAIDTSDCGGNEPTCITGGDPVIVGVCAITDCVDECDCPAAPLSGTAVAACGDIAGGGNLCHIDCAGGSTCPTGMECFAEVACVWPGEGAEGVAFGDCFNEGGSICGLEGICLSDDAEPSTVAVCTEECSAVGDCGTPPPGGTAPVSCQDVTGEGDNECVLDCAGGGTCPTGMTCFSASICMWN